MKPAVSKLQETLSVELSHTLRQIIGHTAWLHVCRLETTDPTAKALLEDEMTEWLLECLEAIA